MNHHSLSVASVRRSTLASMTALALLFAPRAEAAEADPATLHASAQLEPAAKHTGWSLNATPVLILPKDGYGWGGGADPELKYTLEVGPARVSAGGRVGAYYAKDQFGISLMPTVRVMVPVGAFEPYVSGGVGGGWLPNTDRADVMSMARAGFVYRFSKKVAIGIEGTRQQLRGTEFRFFSIGSMMAVDL